MTPSNPSLLEKRIVSLQPAIMFLLPLLAGLLPTQVLAQGIFTQRAEAESFMQPPRSVTRLMLEAQTGLNDARYSDAFSALYQILADAPSDTQTPGDALRRIASQDYLLDTFADGPKKSTIRGQADGLLALLSDDAAEALELQYGVTAQQELTQALAARDTTALASVSRNFPHTTASYKALGGLAALAIAEGESILATRYLDRLCTYPRARKLFGVELVLNCALMHQTIGRETRAVELMSLAGDWFPGESVTLDGQQIALNTQGGWAERLRAAVENGPVSIMVPAENWSTAGGSANRNAISKIGLPIPTLRWSKRIHSNTIELSGLNTFRQASQQSGRFLLPKFELRVNNNTVFTKTTDDAILAIDLESGLGKYEMYRWAAAVQLSRARLLTAEARGELSHEVRSRVWGDPSFGQFSCDDDYLYAVRELEAASAGNAFRGLPTKTNFLAVYHTKASEGGVAWNSGGSFENAQAMTGPLTGAFFLGPPLSYKDELFCLVEQRSLVDLVVLDRHTGELLWRQQLCNTTGRPAGADRTISKQALSPTIADGLIVCPTGRGAIVAVDATSRRIVWANVYKVQQVTNASNNSGTGFHETGWQDSRVVAGEGYAAFTPSETDQLHAYDLLTGEQVLPSITRQRARYIAGIHRGEIIVVGQQRMVGFSVKDRRTRLGPEFANGKHLVGRGIWMGDEMLLPLSDRKVARISTSTGETLEEVQVDRRLGNLFAYKGQLLVVNDSSVNAYFTREALEGDLDAENPSFQQLNRRALVELAKKHPAEAIELARQALEIAPKNNESEYIIVDAVLAGLDQDYNRFRPVAEQFESLVSDDQRFQYLRRIVEGDLAAGQYRSAVSRLLQMLDDQLPDTPAPRSAVETYFQLSDDHRVDYESWIHANLERAYAQLSDDDLREANELIGQRLPRIVGANIYKRRKLLRYFVAIPAAHEAILRLASDLQTLEEYTQAETFLIPLLNAEDAQIAAQAKALILKQCPGEFRNLTPLGRTVHDRLQATTEATKDESELREQLANLNIQWNEGRLENRVGSQYYQYGQIVHQQGQRFGRPSIRVALQPRSLVLYNNNGEMVARPPFPQDLDNGNIAFVQATVHGGLLLIETLTEIAAFDIQRSLEIRSDSMLWRYSLLRKSTRRYEASSAEWGPNSLGYSRGKRSLPGAQIAKSGNLTEHGLPLQVSNEIVMLDPWTGKTKWTRADATSEVSFAVDGNRLAVSSAKERTVRILDARDGSLLEELEGIEDVSPWLVKGRYFIDYQQRHDGTGNLIEAPVDVFIWDPFTGNEIFRLNLTVGSRANVTENRYVTIVEPNNKLHLLDLAQIGPSADAFHTEFNVETNQVLDTIGVERFGDRMLVMSNSSDRDLPTREIELYRPTIEPDARVPIHGFVYSIDLKERQLLWSQPGEMYNMEFPRIQPRNMPYVVTHYCNRKSRTISLAILDLRTGTLGFASRLKWTPQSEAAASFTCVSNPAQNAFTISLDTRNFRFLATDAPTSPQPTVFFKAK